MPVLTPHLLKAWALPVAEDGGGTHARGTVHVIGGDPSTPGAVLLAGLAALRVGAGRLQVTTVRETSVALGVALPEARVVGVESLAGAEPGAEAVLVGPGMLGTDATREVLTALLPRLAGSAVVLDAVALTALAGHADLLAPLRGQVVLTPNLGELNALVGEELPGEQAALEAACTYGAVVATQGWVAAPDGRLWQDQAGSIGLGRSGSGDVLAGAVAGLLARGAEPCQAACWGQFLHAAAGDRLVAGKGRVGYLARELLDELPAALATLTG